MPPSGLVVWLEDVARYDVGRVGGKNASLGEMIRSLSAQGIRVPVGFATTADAYWRFLEENTLRARISDILSEYANGSFSLSETGFAIRSALLK
jgi:pyruvate,water dikinase